MSVLLSLVLFTSLACPDSILDEARRIRDSAGRPAEVRHLRQALAGCEPDARFASATAQRFAEAAREARNPDLLADAYRLGRQAVEMDSRSSYAHEILSEVFAIDLEMSSLYRKAVLSDSVRVHAERALRFDPGNAKALFTLGRWHVEVANLPWYAVAARNLIVRDPVESTNAIAIGYLERAAALRPTDETRFWLGVAYARDGQEEKARSVLTSLSTRPWTDRASEELRRLR